MSANSKLVFSVGKRDTEKHSDNYRLYFNVLDMKQFSLSAGDLVTLLTPSNVSCCGIAWPSFTCASKEIQLSSLTRLNLSAQLGDLVSFSKVCNIFPKAIKVSVEPTSKDILSVDDTLYKALKAELLNKVINKGYNFDIIYGGISTRFKVVDFSFDPTELNTPQMDAVPVFSLIVKNTTVSSPKSKKNINSVQEKLDSKKPQTGFKNVGGLSQQIQQVKEMVELTLLCPQVFLKYGLVPPRGILLFGPPGTGKTLIARSVGQETKATVFTINGAEIINKYYGETEANLSAIFKNAKEKSPSIIFIDEIDALCPKRNSDSYSNAENRVVTTLLTLMDGFDSNESGNRVVVIAATNRPNSLDEALRRPGRFDREIEISVPNTDARLDILKVLLNPVSNNLSQTEIEKIAENAHGFVGADLMALCREASLIAIKRSIPISTDGTMFESLTEKLNINKSALKSQQKNLGDIELVITYQDFLSAMPLIKPSCMREVMLEVPKVYWDDIGGQHEIKSRLIEAVDWPLKSPELFTRMGINPPKGILLYGPPGCSKTLIAKALATESKLNFIAIKGPELFNKYVGESEKAVKQVFKRARLSSPSIIFFDEIDALTVNRSSDSNGGSSSVSERVLSQLLTELDGIEPLVKVTVVAATNRPDIIDPALLRPGRFDRILYVPPPDLKSRCSIFEIQLKKMAVSEQVTPETLAQMTDGFSGAEVVNFCQEAAIAAMEDNIDASFVELEHFKKVRLGMKPRISQEMIKFYDDFRNKNKNSAF
ncbi:hypothetical protein BB561_005889 [Smittium simulii]|uniref:AAA+ ATPase domain-containing protein n=1 Tax=Smittium simulii TaxID=133385 RepID=A0A2T9Y7U6_9FUNG|nr:hypothetical protein BB561_005889 [Smittium simulii]